MEIVDSDNKQKVYDGLFFNKPGTANFSETYQQLDAGDDGDEEPIIVFHKSVSEETDEEDD